MAAARTAAAAAFRACLCWPTDAAPARRLGALAACIALLAPAASAAAQSEPRVGDVPLARYVSTASYLEQLNTYIVGYETWIGPCPDPEPVERVNVLLPESSVPLPGNPDPAAPQWIEQLRVTGCSAPYERFVYVSARGDTPVFHARLLGTSRTTPKLESDAVEAVVAAERDAAVARGCPATQPVRVFTATFDERFDAEYGTGWRETWQIADCRGVRDLTLTFTPDHSGATVFEFAPAAR
jgi:hypothetical protein